MIITTIINILKFNFVKFEFDHLNHPIIINHTNDVHGNDEFCITKIVYLYEQTGSSWILNTKELKNIRAPL